MAILHDIAHDELMAYFEVSFGYTLNNFLYIPNNYVSCYTIYHSVLLALHSCSSPCVQLQVCHDNVSVWFSAKLLELPGPLHLDCHSSLFVVQPSDNNKPQ